MKKRLVTKTINSLIKYLYDKKLNLFNLHYDIKTKKINKTKTSFVNAHCAYVLYKLGHKDISKKILNGMLNGPLFNKNEHLFSYTFQNKDKNGCSNLLAVKALALAGYKKEAKLVMDAVLKKLYDKRKGLFARSSRDNKLFVAQTNLWGILAFESLGLKKEAKKLLQNVVKNFYNKKQKCLISQSSTKKGKYKERYIFCDDNFLFCSIAKKEYSRLCKNITEKMLSSPLLDKEKNLFNRSLRLNDNFLNKDKSAYKNALCLLGLKSMKNKFAIKLEESIIENLYNKKLNLFFDCFCDSNALICYAFSY